MEHQAGVDDSSQRDAPIEKCVSSEASSSFPETTPSPPFDRKPDDGEKISCDLPEMAKKSERSIIGSDRSNFISSDYYYYRRGKFWPTSSILKSAKAKQYYRRGKFWPVWLQHRNIGVKSEEKTFRFAHQILSVRKQLMKVTELDSKVFVYFVLKLFKDILVNPTHFAAGF